MDRALAAVSSDCRAFGVFSEGSKALKPRSGLGFRV